MVEWKKYELPRDERGGGRRRERSADISTNTTSALPILNLSLRVRVLRECETTSVVTPSCQPSRALRVT